MTASFVTGEFVCLRALDVSDAARTLAWRSGSRARLLNDGATTIEAQAAWIAARPPSERNYVIELRGGTPVGMLALIAIDPHAGRGETARFLIGEESAVRGIPAAVEAMKLLYQVAFGELGLHRVHGWIAASNRRMIVWQQYLGMRVEGRLRDHLMIGGKHEDAVLLGLLEDEYRSTALPKMNALIAAARAGAAGEVA